MTAKRPAEIRHRSGRSRFWPWLVMACLGGALAVAAAVGADRATTALVAVTIAAPDGEQVRGILSRAELPTYLERARARLMARRDRARVRIADTITREVGAITGDMGAGIDEYADWYFTWGTTHEIMFTALRAYAGAIGSSDVSPREAAAAAMNKMFDDKFIERVLKPDVHLPRLASALQRIAAVERADITDAATEELEQMRGFVGRAAADPGGGGAISALWISPAVVDWTTSIRNLEALRGRVGQDGPSPGLPPADAVDFSSLARTALIQSAINNIAGFTTSLATPTLTVLDSGNALTAFLAGIFGPFAPFFTPEMLVAGTGVAMVTDYALVKAAEIGGREPLLQSARDGLTSVRKQLDGLFHQTLDRYSEGLYAELERALPSDR